jgi:hypothetical protein
MSKKCWERTVHIREVVGLYPSVPIIAGEMPDEKGTAFVGVPFSYPLLTLINRCGQGKP